MGRTNRDYEGDIVKAKYGKAGEQIYRIGDMGEYGVTLYAQVKDKQIPEFLYFWWKVPNRETIEVIGNIYENPELLK